MFVRHLLEGRKKKDAAALAGCPVKTAGVAASKLLMRPRVLEALRRGAETKLNAGVAVGAIVLKELAESAKSEEVRFKAALALLDRGGLPLVKQTETRHLLTDTRTDVELIEHVRGLARKLKLPLPGALIESPTEPVEVEPGEGAA